MKSGAMMVVYSDRSSFLPLREIVEKLGYECVGIELVNDGGAAFLRVYIDTLGGVQVKDCELVSRSLSSFLDQNSELVPGKYFLEVSSPGIERPLFNIEDYRRFAGRKVRLKMRPSVRGRKVLRGVILSAENDKVEIMPESDQEGEGTPTGIPLGDISRGNLVYEDDKSKRRSS
ncbi:MAG: ribosome maturation factor RimP [Synergistota bacterium]|nr:ribosome maturation factor RimP [Synergistota bacterium]